jgi:CarD family transcriptional regulator
MKDKKTPEFTFDIGSKVFYPTHGAGSIKAKKFIEFQGEKKEYFEFKFIDAQLTVSTPVENVYNLGIRPVLTPKEIKSKIEVLKKKPTKKPKSSEYNDIITHIQELDILGEINAFVEIIQLCNSVRKTREKEGRLIPVSITKHFRTAIAHIIAELAISTDTDLEASAVKFTKFTAIEV